MEREVDPNDTGSFDQMNLISLIARRPRQIDHLEEIRESLKKLKQSNDEEDQDDQRLKISLDDLRFGLGNQGEKMQDHEIEEILQDCADLIHNEQMIIDDFANYLMSR